MFTALFKFIHSFIQVQHIGVRGKIGVNFAHFSYVLCRQQLHIRIQVQEVSTSSGGYRASHFRRLILDWTDWHGGAHPSGGCLVLTPSRGVSLGLVLTPSRGVSLGLVLTPALCNRTTSKFGSPTKFTVYLSSMKNWPEFSILNELKWF